jgi:predicted Fe-Mo cluster-binding NifX family protein
MNICIPVTQDSGLESRVSPQFGSASFFVIVDPESRACRTVPIASGSDEHGRRQPMAALEGQAIDGVVVVGIGPGALSKLQAAGIRVYMARAGSAAQAIESFNSGALAEITPAATRPGQGQGQQGPGTHGHGPQGQSRFGQGARGSVPGGPKRGGRSGER